VAEAIGAQHFNIDIEEATKSIGAIFTKTTGKTPKYVAHGGTYTEDLAL
jgi:NAD+ synthase (glutamine-hydrolysing)